MKEGEFIDIEAFIGYQFQCIFLSDILSTCWSLGPPESCRCCKFLGSLINSSHSKLDEFQGCDEGALGEVIPNTNCQRFTACSNGLESACPADMIFVQSVGMCRPAAQFTCEDSTTGPNTGYAKLCGAGQAQGPYPDSCAAFVQCNTNQVLKCFNGYLFDIVKSMCRPADEATCYTGSGDDVPKYVTEQCATLPLGSFISHRDCSKYYICDGASIQVATCPAGKHFSRAYNGCVPILQAGCRALGAVCVGQSVGYSFPALDCSQYYTCPQNAVPQLNVCAKNTVYNPNTSSCVAASSYQCDEDIIIPGSSAGTPPTEQTIPTTTQTPPNWNPNLQCSTLSTGTKIADPNDCTNYYICNNGSAIALVCAQGQFFSSQNQLCSTTNPSC